MINIRKANERGHTNLDWLDSWHTFSFDSYYDPKYNHYQSLRVINEDIVAPKKGFGTHSHRDMEILTYVLEGALEHKDSLGNGSIIKSGELQRMSAGTGIHHSEYNYSALEPVHLLQIWIMPNQHSLNPSYEQKFFDIEYGAGLKLIASANGLQNSLQIHQDVSVYTAKLEEDENIRYEIDRNRALWLQVAEGRLSINGHDLHKGDGLAARDLSILELKSFERSHILLFDLAKLGF